MTGRQDPERLLRTMFDAALAAADPMARVPPYLPEHLPPGRVLVVGAGKASARMAQAVEKALPTRLHGLVITRHGHGVPCEHIEIVEAAHPVPDETGMRAARQIMAMVSDLDEDDLVIALISGGGSSLLSMPAPGLSLEHKRQLSIALLRSGATIEQINLVRIHLSGVKGGRLAAAAYPASTIGLLISDVPGDDPALIASGPTVAGWSTPGEALAVLDRYAIDVPRAVRAHLSLDRTAPSPGDVAMSRVRNHLIATPQQSLEAAAAVAVEAGVRPVILGDSIEGEARDVGRVLAGVTHQVLRHGQPVAAPCVLLSGGETTVTVKGSGRGGRNVEFILSLAISLGGAPGVHALAADTDGVDGAVEVAGAVIGPSTLQRARDLGLAPASFLDDNDAHRFFELLGAQVVTGPTLTNVNDFRAIMISKA